MKGKTVLAISHGQFLHHLTCYFTGGSNDKGVASSGMMNPNNNALTIIDFDVEEV